MWVFDMCMELVDNITMLVLSDSSDCLAVKLVTSIDRFLVCLAAHAVLLVAVGLSYGFFCRISYIEH
jgi:hypothetical protein